ncbi:MAG: TonB-dependent receptor [Burkholderiaceae bacterium]
MPYPRFQLAPLALAMALACLAGIAVPVRAQAPAAAMPIAVPAQPLGAALNELARQARLQLMVHPDLVAGKQAPAVSGTLTPRQALDRMLAGSGLEARIDGTEVVVRAASASSSSPATLAEVTVTALPARIDDPYAGGQIARGGRLGVLGDKDFMDTPFSITSYTSRTLDDVQAQTVSDVLIRDPSIGVETATGHWLGNFNIRGFTVQSNDFTINGIGGLHAQNVRMPAELIERVDVIRGPSAFLSGITPNGSIGGQINVETKRAQADPLTRLTVGYTSDSLLRTQIDVGRRFGERKQWGVRVNGSWENGDTVIDNLSSNRRFFSVGIDYSGDRFRFNLDAYALKEKARGGAPFMGQIRGATAMPGAPDNRTNAFDKAWHDADAQLVLAKGEYDLNRDWTIKAGVGRSVGRSYGASTGEYVFLLDGNGSYSATDWFSPSRKESKTGFAELNGKFSTGPIRHQFAASFQKIDIDNFYEGTSSPAWTGSIYDPASQPYSAPDTGSPPKSAETSLGGFAIADTLSWNDRIYVTLGARRQSVKASNFNTSTGATTSRYDASATTPFAAAVLRIAPSASLYANYAEGLSQGAIVGGGYTNSGEVFAPYKSKQYEAGFKWDAGRVANTLSLYQLSRPSAISDASTTPLPTYRMDGEQRNRGVEWQFFGEPWRGTRFNGGVIYTQARLTRTQGGATDGNTAVGVPRWRATLGAEYDIAAVPGLSVNGRWTHAGSQYVNAANTMKLDAWHRFDIGARYQTKIGGRNVIFRANIDNLLDKSYWEAATARAVVLNAPRTFKLSATMDF